MHQPHAGRPSTLAISCGSMNIEVVPCGMTARAEFGDGHHAAFDMHVAVAEAGDEIAAARLDDLACRRRWRRPRSGPMAAKRPASMAISMPGMISPGMDIHPAPVA